MVFASSVGTTTASRVSLIPQFHGRKRPAYLPEGNRLRFTFVSGRVLTVSERHWFFVPKDTSLPLGTAIDPLRLLVEPLSPRTAQPGDRVIIDGRVDQIAAVLLLDD
jgi:hypothetical protein